MDPLRSKAGPAPPRQRPTLSHPPSRRPPTPLRPPMMPLANWSERVDQLARYGFNGKRAPSNTFQRGPPKRKSGVEDDPTPHAVESKTPVMSPREPRPPATSFYPLADP